MAYTPRITGDTWEAIARQAGWSTDDQVTLLLEYIARQEDDAALIGYARREAEDEAAQSAPKALYDALDGVRGEDAPKTRLPQTSIESQTYIDTGVLPALEEEPKEEDSDQ
jgi:hypothetical protein